MVNLQLLIETVLVPMLTLTGFCLLVICYIFTLRM